MSSDSAQTIASETEIVPANCFKPLDLPFIYGRVAPLEVDLGCGDGSFLAAMAAENPNSDFLGVERLLGRVRSACRKIEQRGVTNARVTRFEISYAVEHLLPAKSISAFYILFPDPWPKRRHAPRRLVTQNFFGSLYRALAPAGNVRLATDDSDYFRQITRFASQSQLFAVVPNAAPAIATTKFERRFRERGIAIHRLELRKV